MMRSFACVLVATVVAASTLGALPSACVCDATIASTHSCCALETASVDSPTCCTIGRGAGQQGPAEAVTIGPAPSTAPLRATFTPSPAPLRRVPLAVAAPTFETVPLYLQQLSLLI